MSRIGYLGVALAIISLLPFSYFELRLHLHHWEPLRVPVSLDAESANSPSFRADLTGTYVVSLVFTPLPDIQREDCLIGDDFPRGSCTNVQRSLDVDWTVTATDGIVIAHERFRPHAFSGSSGELGVELGTFEAQAGKRYGVALNVLQRSPELNMAHPNLKVEAHRVYWEKWVILAQLGILFAFVLGAFAVGCIAWNFVSPKKRSS